MSTIVAECSKTHLRKQSAIKRRNLSFLKRDLFDPVPGKNAGLVIGQFTPAARTTSQSVALITINSKVRFIFDISSLRMTKAMGPEMGWGRGYDFGGHGASRRTVDRIVHEAEPSRNATNSINL